MKTTGHRRSAWAVFRWPLALAVVSLAGLAAALLGDGLADAVSWLLLGSLLVVIGLAGSGWIAHRQGSLLANHPGQDG